MAQIRRRTWRGGLALAALLASGGAGYAQSPQSPMPVEPAGPTITSPFDVSFCLCLERDIQTRQAELTVRRNAYDSLATEIRDSESAIARDRPRVDVNDQAAIDAFKRRLDELDAMKARQEQVTLPDYQAAVSSYNDRVAQYTQRCSGRPIDPGTADQVRASLVCKLSE